MRRAPGELVSAPEYALAFRLLEPAPEVPARLLVLAHGWGTDETQLAGLGAGVDGDTLVALPRGPRSAGEESFGWYRVSFPDGEPEAEPGEARDSLGRFNALVMQLRARHAIGAERTVVAGFSQGGALAICTALTYPADVGGFAMLSGRIPDGLARVESRMDLARLEGLLIHGHRDDILPLRWAQRAAGQLHALGVAHVWWTHDAGHQLTDAAQRAFQTWFADRKRAWNGTGTE